MKPLLNKDFKSQSEYENYKGLVSLFWKYIGLDDQGHEFWIDGECWGNPYIEREEIGFKSGRFRQLFFGDCTHEDGTIAADFDLNEIKERVKIKKLIEVDL